MDSGKFPPVQQTGRESILTQKVTPYREDRRMSHEKLRKSQKKIETTKSKKPKVKRVAETPSMEEFYFAQYPSAVKPQKPI
jgi:hypothetical protein